jgi:hypothetical protein
MNRRTKLSRYSGATPIRTRHRWRRAIPDRKAVQRRGPSRPVSRFFDPEGNEFRVGEHTDEPGEEK